MYHVYVTFPVKNTVQSDTKNKLTTNLIKSNVTLFNGQIRYIEIPSKSQAAHFYDRRGLLEAPEGEGYFTDTFQIREINSTLPCLLNKGSVQ